MNTGQMLTVLGALMLLSMVSLAINSMITEKTLLMIETEAGLNAISLAQTMMDEILVKNFDVATAPPAPAIYPHDATKVYDVNLFTSPSSFGPNATEVSKVPQPDVSTPFKSLNNYNDVDDYHGYVRTVFTPRLGNFTIKDTVFYVSESNPEEKVTTQTFFKKVMVSVFYHNNQSNKDERILLLSDIAVYRRYF
jgi:hypothetical protein